MPMPSRNCDASSNCPRPSIPKPVVWPSVGSPAPPSPAPAPAPATSPAPAHAVKYGPLPLPDYRPITADKSPSLVLVDTTNAFFSWYYRTLRSYNRARHLKPGTTVAAHDSSGMASLKAAFETTFRRGMRAILSITGSSKRDVIFAIDDQRQRIWRHDVLRDASTDRSSYKAQRVTRTDAGIPAVMRFLYDDLMPRYAPGSRVGTQRAEADDVIGIVARLVNARAPKRSVFIISDDSDFVQLLDHPTNEIYSQRLRRARDKYPRDARIYKQLKILQGDRPDNIDAAFPRCGPKTAEAIVNDPELFAAKIKKHGRAKYDRNRLLIDFDMIPSDIKSAIVQRALLIRHKRMMSPSRSPFYSPPASRPLAQSKW